MIIIDPKGKHPCADLIAKFARKDKRIKIFKSKEKMKCGTSYSKALELANGDICCVIDGDDALSHKKSLVKLVRQYDKHEDLDFIWTQFYLCDSKLTILKKGFSSCPTDESLLEAGMRGKHCFSHWRTFRTKLRDKGVIFKPGLSAAVDKWMGYSLEELGRGAFLGRALYLYRQRIGGLSYTGRKQWKIMKQEFTAKRKEQGIKPYPVRIIK